MNMKFSGNIDRVYDSGKIKKELGWKQEFWIEEIFNQLKNNSEEILPPI